MSETLTRFLDRQERVLSSRIGAGHALHDSFHFARWNRELVADTGMTFATARRLNDYIFGMLRAGLAASASVATVHTVYGEARSRVLAEIACGGDGIGDHLVYRLFNAKGRLIYVGITDRGPLRLVEHARRKTWWPEVARVEFERFGSRAEAANRETFLIRTADPVYNLRGKIPAIHRDAQGVMTPTTAAGP